MSSLKPHNPLGIKCYKSHHYHQNIKTDSKMSVLKTQTQALVELPCCQLCRAYTLLNLLPSKSNLSFAKLTVVKRGLVNKLSLGNLRQNKLKTYFLKEKHQSAEVRVTFF